MKFQTIRHPIRSYRRWRLIRERIIESKVNLQASRKHRLPLEQCTKDQLGSAMRHNEHEAARYEKIVKGKPHKRNYDTLASWHRMCQRPIQELIDLMPKDGMRVEDIPWKKRRKPTEELMRIRRLG